MPVYTYKGTNKAGTSVSGEMSATSKSEAQNQLRRQQITPKKMSEKGKEFNMPQFGGSVSAKELAIFTRQFSVMIDAGLPLVQCLEILAGQQENKLFQKVLAATIDMWKAPHLGMSDPAAWTTMQQTLLDAKLLTTAQDLSKTYTNEFVP